MNLRSLYNDRDGFFKKVLDIENQLKDVNMDTLAKNTEAIALMVLFLRYMRVSKHSRLLQFLDSPELLELPNSRML